MSGAPHDLGDLIKWTARDGWRDRVDAVMAEHFEPAMTAFDLTFEEINDALGGGWAGTLWGCAFEDFLTRRFGPDDENPVEAYLRRRGWRERVAARTYMTALQGSVMSLHEVSDIVPGQSFRARDLIRGGEPVLVTEWTATQTLRPWDRIAARIVAAGDQRVIAGGVLAFTLEGTDRLFATLRERAAARPHGRRTRKADGGLGNWTGSDEDLRSAAPLFSSAWLLDVLLRALDRTPQVFNSDGDEVVFHTVRFPFAAKATVPNVEARLGQLGDLRRETATFWNWVGPSPAKRPAVKGEKAIDHRSHVAQGIALEPQNKIGPAGTRREGRGEHAERVAEHDALARRNGERIIADPGLALAALTRQQSTFTRRDLARMVDRHTADAEQFAEAMAKVEASPEVMRLGTDGRGQERFTTREMLATEQRMEQAAGKLAERQAHRVTLRRRLAELTMLGREQVLAFRHVTQAQDLSVVVGYAGTGKSTMLGEARAAWEADGYQVRGAALSGIAAEQLEGGAGIASRTVHSLLFQWEQGREVLTNRDVLVVDEAGMIGSRQMERLLSAAESAGAKVVLVGDPEQLQAIEAGAAFRAIAERVGTVELTEVRRQREAWQQQATRELATGRTGEALARYERAGMVRQHATLDDAKAAIVAGWDAARRETPGASQIMLAYRRDDVRDLNARARAVRQAAGELGADYWVQTERGARDFAAGDRVYFLRNERSLGVKNGTLGTIERIEGHAPGQGDRLVVRLDDGRLVGFDVKDYAHIDHGYAATVHKSQGVTVGRTHVLASSHMDRHVAYVGLSRHRERVDLHWSEDQVGSRERLTRVLGRDRLKDTSLDYGFGRTEVEREILRASAADSARAYAERRGLVPESEIVLRDRQVETPHAEPARPRRGLFAGLKLEAGLPEAVPAPAVASALTEQDRAADRLVQSVGTYARAWSDAARMRQAGLPVLPHQTEALAQADRALDRQLSGFGQDLDAVLTRTPRLEQGVGTEAGLAALIEAGWVMRAEREKLEERARAAVRAWDKLEQAYERAEETYDHSAQRTIGGQIERFAQDLKRDLQLDSVLRQRGQQLGIIEGSRLAQVVESEGIDRELMRELGLRHSRGLGLGR